MGGRFVASLFDYKSKAMESLCIESLASKYGAPKYGWLKREY